METKPFYLTTTLPYVNADPHIGFASEIIAADAYARFQRLMGRKVFFNTGTDEHGQKLADKAKEAGQVPQAYVDEYAAKFGELREMLDLSYDAFIRTTDEKHIIAAQEMWRRSFAKGDIYKKSYTGLYCVGCEMFKKEGDLVEGKCPIHPNLTPQTIEEENYFFALSKYQDRLIEYLSQEGVIVPEWRRQEALEFVKAGLEDFSISRETKRMSWGIPVPDDETQVMYVWFDALTNYISTLDWPNGENFKTFWKEGETVQVAGKDQVRFQSIMWQAMLMSADVETTDTVVYHGFITSGGQKMSKSLGNVISPAEMVARYGTDATRYLLIRHVHPFEDTDVTWERLDEWYNANLANGIGNLASRIMKMAETHIEKIDTSVIPDIVDYQRAFESYNVQSACEVVWNLIGELDARIQAEEPFKIIKADPVRGKEIIAALVLRLSTIAYMLRPVMPSTAEVIRSAIHGNKKPENLFARIEAKAV